MNVPNEKLLEDIANTEKELSAYQMLANAHRILADLPENIGANQRIHNLHADNYRNTEQMCAAFLRELHQLKAERGL